MRADAPWVVDTSVFVSYLRVDRYLVPLRTAIDRGAVILPGVVLAELYAGAATTADRADVEVLRRSLGERILGVSPAQWVLAGRCLAQYTRRWGRVRPRDHLPDLLVALAAREVGAVLMSENLRDMRRWSSMIQRTLGGPAVQVRTP